MRGWFFVAIAATSAMACSTSERAEPAPTYRDVVGPLLAEKCAGCHQGATAAGGWRATSYIDVIGCLPDGTSAVQGENPPILRALSTPTHAAVAGVRDQLEQWLRDGARASGTGVHPAEFLDPRTNGSHAKYLRARRYSPMLDASDPESCGTCHEGAPNHVAGKAGAARATACTTCHSEDKGPLACTTCHGDKGHAYPPRATCFHPEAKPDTTHAAHLGPGKVHTQQFECKTCHPTPDDGKPGGTHADGYVEVVGVGFDSASKSCSNSCHAQKDGAIPKPVWNESKMACNSCHGAPPKDHYKGACSFCHHEVNADGTALTGTKLHFNGKVDLGDGSGKCGACHGTGDDPWPTTGAHAKHKSPSSSVAVPCSTCHEVPGPTDKHPLGTGTTPVRLAGLAPSGGMMPKFDSATKSCSAVYCHAGVGGGSVPAPTWTQGPTASACGACHSLPPPAPHTTATGCGSAGFCHAGAVSGGTITPAGSLKHVNGNVELSATP